MPVALTSTKPLLRVSRPVAACSRCRAAKIKCDGKLPACTACEKTGRESECSSSNDEFAKGKERSYVASLETRLEKLRDRLQFARQRKASVAMHDGEDTATSSGRKDSYATIRAAVQGKAARQREATDVDQLVSDFGYMAVNATTRDFEAAATQMTFARLIMAACVNEVMPGPKSNFLPSRPAAMLLIQHYLNHVYSLFPVFPETVLFNAVDAIYSNDARFVSDFERWLVYMVLGIGATSQSRTNHDAYYKDGVNWVSRALEYADTVLVPGYQMQMQALLLLVQYAMLDPAHFDSWQLIGFACRAAADLGYHSDPPKEHALDKQVLDERRRLFWSIYCLDRSISMVHARAFSFTDDTVNVGLPHINPSSPADTLGNALSGQSAQQISVLLCQLRRAQSSWYQELFQSSRDPIQQTSGYIWRMCYDMQTWAESFPDSLPPAVRAFFETELLYSYVYCLAPSCRVPAVSDYGKSLIFEYAIAYTEKVFPISQDPINTGFYTYHDALRVYFVGSQFVAVLSDRWEQILSGQTPLVATAAGEVPPPPIPNLGRADNVARSLACIDHISQTLTTFGERWTDSQALQSNFESQIESLTARLHARQRQHSPRTDRVPAVQNQMHTQGYIAAPPGEAWSRMTQQQSDQQFYSNNDYSNGQLHFQ